MRGFEVASHLAVGPDVLWRHATTPAGVNRELAPFLRMTFPSDLADLTEGWRPGERRFRSWLLLFGVLPVEYDDVAFDEIDPGRRFLERSTLWSQRVWEHERTIEPTDLGSRLTDRVRFDRGSPCSAWRSGPSSKRSSIGATGGCEARFGRIARAVDAPAGRGRAS